MGSEIRNIWIVGVLLIVVVGLLVISVLNVEREESDVKEVGKLKSFSSYNELQEFLKKSKEDSYGGYRGLGVLEEAAVGSVVSGQGAFAAKDADSGGERASDYSQTNIQVEGVDEPDIVKNDGKYIYNIVGNKVVIVDAFPASRMEIVSEIELKNKDPLQIFVNGDKLVIFSQGYEEVVVTGENAEESVVVNEKVAAGAGGIAVDSIMPVPGYYGRSAKVYVLIYDISSRDEPKLDDEIVFDGNYVDSRMIGEHVYIISNKYVENERPILPAFRVNGVEEKIAIGDVYYFDYFDYSYVFNSISAINLDNGDVNSKVYLTGSANEIYASEDNIYLTYTKFISGREYWDKTVKEVIVPLLPENEREKIGDILDSDKGYNEKISEINEIVQDYSNSLTGDEKSDFDGKLYKALNEFEKEIRRERQKTVINKINVDELDIEYIGKGEVRGTILNQFSMDESDGMFRIATTTGNIFDESSENNLYVLDEELNVVGKIEKLAPGEKIYSARFIGDRAYLVTFKKVDPFYVIDLSNAENPKVLGYLKIPGYSDYLHSYDENHIIGVGKEAIDASELERSGRNLDFAWYQGLKIAIFDVSDVSNPKESAKIVVGDRGTDSNALYDHKAFLFDKTRNLLVLPIRLAEIDKSKYAGEIPANAYGQQVWQGAYVFDIRKDSIKIKGRVTHFDDIKKYGPARDEPIGAERKDASGNSWIKVKENGWKMEKQETTGRGAIYFPEYDDIPESDYMWSDEMIDSLPGGINYNPYFEYQYQIQRSLYMDDVLYTLSPKKIRANDLDDLQELGKVELPYDEGNRGVVIY